MGATTIFFSRRRAAGNWVAVAVLVFLTAPAAHTQAATKRDKALDYFEKAVSRRETLNGREPNAETWLDVIQAFRRVYLSAPASSRADDSLLAVGQLYTELTERFGWDSFRDRAVDAYQFLIREYPSSPLLPQAREELARLEARPVRIQTSTTSTPGVVAQITDIRHWSFPGLTRVVVDLQAEVSPHGDRLRNPERIYFDLPNTKLGASLKAKNLQIGDALVQRIRIAQTQTDVTRVVADLSGEDVDYTLSTLANPPRVVLELRRKGAVVPPAPEPPGQANSLAAKPTVPVASPLPKPSEATALTPAATKAAIPTSPPQAAVIKATLPPAPDVKGSASRDASPGPVLRAAIPKTEIPPPPVQAPPATPPEPRVTAKAAEVNSRGQRNLIRALGLKVERVVIDAGHGGHDTGTIGPTGLMEKDLTLNLAQRLGALVSERLGSEVIYTRTDDTFVALEDRTALANEKQADLFISVHANSSRLRAVSGIETYYLNLSSDPEALEVAARENAASQKSVHDLQDLVKKITLTEKIAESREFALHVQRSLHRSMSKENAALRNRGVRKAPFVVLIGAQMPAVLAEVSFLSNTRDEKLLKSESYRQKLAEALFAGVANYAGSLSRVEVASNGDE